MTAAGVTWVAVFAAVSVVASLPYWLPRVVVALRVRIFALINGDEGIEVPGDRVGVEDFKRLYADPAANGRSRGAALSDLFWYWLAPGPEVHQEHLEPGPRYDEVARATRSTLSRLRRDEWAELVARCADRELDRLAALGRPGRAWPREIRLRDAMMPLWAAVYYEVVFGEQCPDEARDLIVANADDVVSALKCTRLRHMGRRDRLTRYLRARLASGAVPHALPAALDDAEKVYYLQGTYFNTAVVQMSEAMAHLLLALAARPDLQRRLREEPEDTGLIDRVIDETLRVYPLFGVAHRITSAEIALGEAAIPAGSVLLFNYPAFQHSGVPDAAVFDPDRWQRDHAEQLRHIPFGVGANRPCPARAVAPLTMRVAARRVLRRYALATAAGHTRSLPNRGPCLLLPLGTGTDTDAQRPPALRLARQRLRDRWEDVWRSLVQLVLGTYMVWDARRLRLCATYFAAQEDGR